MQICLDFFPIDFCIYLLSLNALRVDLKIFGKPKMSDAAIHTHPPTHTHTHTVAHTQRAHQFIFYCQGKLEGRAHWGEWLRGAGREEEVEEGGGCIAVFAHCVFGHF